MEKTVLGKLMADYAAWETRREDLSRREDGDFLPGEDKVAPGDEWHYSDDEGIELLHRFAALHPGGPTMAVGRYLLNDALTHLAVENGAVMPDEAVDDLTNLVADVFDSWLLNQTQED